ncbi:MAG: tyrosine-type recombinase/integrase [Thermoleophilia bacterium]
MSRHEKTSTPGVYRKHVRSCARRGSAKCSCPYEAMVYLPREKRQVRKHFARLAEAKSWRQDALRAVRENKLRPRSKTTVEDASAALIAGMRSGAVFDRTGKPYKPSTMRGYERTMRLHVLPRIGHLRLSALQRRDVQAVVEAMQAEGRAASTIQNALNPLQVLCRRAVHDGELSVDPTDGLRLPAVRGKRDRIVDPAEATRLLDALPESERALWATALLAGLRRGELRALRWRDVDFDEGLVRVERSWDDDPAVGDIEVKSDAGRRRVPMMGRLRAELAAHKLRSGRGAEALVFGRTAALPFVPSTTRARALKAWQAANARMRADAERRGEKVDEAALLKPLSPHEARHCAASYLIAAGLNAKELSVYIGHADIRVTYNRYGHLMPGGEAEAAQKMTAFFDAAATAAGAKVG